MSNYTPQHRARQTSTAILCNATATAVRGFLVAVAADATVDLARETVKSIVEGLLDRS